MRKYSIWMYIRNYKFNSLLFKNFCMIFITMFIPLTLLLGVMFHYFQKTNLEKIGDSVRGDLRQIMAVTDTIQSNIVTMGNNLASEDTTLQFVKTPKWEYPDYDTVQNINKMMRSLSMLTGDYVDSIYLYSYRNDYVLTENYASNITKFYDTQWLQDDNRDSYIRVYGRVAVDRNGGTQNCITSVFSVPISKNDGRDGVILVNMADIWGPQLEKDDPGNKRSLFILDHEGRILYHHQPDYLGRDFQKATGYPDDVSLLLKDTGDGEVMIDSAVSGVTNWRYVMVAGLEEYTQQKHTLRNLICSALAGLLLLTGFAAYIISVRVFRPVREIMEMIDNPSKFYNQNARRNGPLNELRYITASFLESLHQKEASQEQLAQYMTSLKEAQVALLQAQINPHFLFNTLQTVNFLAIGLTRSDNAVSSVVGKLSAMLRKIMEVDSNMMTIEEEVEYCKAYLEIEKMRFRDEFEVVWTLEQELLPCYTVKFTLQPILENCIRHAFNQSDEPGLIRIEIFSEEENIVFQVSDNGSGQSRGWIARMNERLQQVEILMGQHIGIQNVNQRIRLIFGSEYGVSYQAQKSGGIMARIVIPQEK